MTEAITDNLKSHQQEVERIRNNPDLSDEAKRRMIALSTPARRDTPSSTTSRHTLAPRFGP
jgi:hypothetical protein